MSRCAFYQYFSFRLRMDTSYFLKSLRQETSIFMSQCIPSKYCKLSLHPHSVGKCDQTSPGQIIWSMTFLFLVCVLNLDDYIEYLSLDLESVQMRSWSNWLAIHWQDSWHLLAIHEVSKFWRADSIMSNFVIDIRHFFWIPDLSQALIFS